GSCALPELCYKRGAGLVALPDPGQFHHYRSEPPIASLPDPLLTFYPATTIRVAVRSAYDPSAFPFANRRMKASRTNKVALCTPIPRKLQSCWIIRPASSGEEDTAAAPRSRSTIRVKRSESWFAVTHNGLLQQNWPQANSGSGRCVRG